MPKFDKLKEKKGTSKASRGLLRENKTLSLKDMLLAEEFPGMGMGEEQDPRSQSIINQLTVLIRTTDFDDNQSVERLKSTIVGILDSVR